MKNLTTQQYGNVLIESKNLAKIRGSGKFSPPPTSDQKINRGNAFENAWSIYNDTEKNPVSPFETSQMYDKSNEKFSEIKYDNLVGNSIYSLDINKGWNDTNVDGVAGYPIVKFASRATHLDYNIFMNFFFSKENLDYIQAKIQEEVFRIKNVKINKQSVDNLLIIMNNYFQYALSGNLPHHNGQNFIKKDSDKVFRRGEDFCSLESKIARLNQSVVEEAVKQVLSGIDMYRTYYKDASSLPMPLTRPEFTSMKGRNVLSENVGINDNVHNFNRAVSSFNERQNIL